MKIKQKTFAPYKGKVYDLSVKNKHSYNVQGLAVHNSGAGSLVCYALGITQVDPIKHGLLFERFLSRKKACLGVDSWVLTYDGPKQLKDIVCGDKLRTHTGRYSEVVAIDKTYDRTDCYEISYGYEEKPPTLQLRGYRYFYYIAGTLICSANHKFIHAEQYQGSVQAVKREFKDWEFVTADEICKSLKFKMTKSYDKFYGIGSDDKTWNILTVKPTGSPQDLIDIRLAEDHTFWVSDRKDGVYVLSHNSLPDIDCLHSSTLVETTNGYKPLSNIEVGTKVIGLNGSIEEVLFVQTRPSTEKDTLYEVFVQINNTIGCLVTTSKHRFFTVDNKEIFVDDLQVGDSIKSCSGNSFILEKRKLQSNITITDITTTGSKSFNVVPFDVIRVDDKLISVHTYLHGEINK